MAVADGALELAGRMLHVATSIRGQVGVPAHPGGRAGLTEVAAHIAAWQARVGRSGDEVTPNSRPDQLVAEVLAWAPACGS